MFAHSRQANAKTDGTRTPKASANVARFSPWCVECGAVASLEGSMKMKPNPAETFTIVMLVLFGLLSVVCAVLYGVWGLLLLKS